jgi:hypothetical protein
MGYLSLILQHESMGFDGPQDKQLGLPSGFVTSKCLEYEIKLSSSSVNYT